MDRQISIISIWLNNEPVNTISRLIYLFMLYVVVVGIGGWSFYLLKGWPLAYGVTLIVQVLLVHLLQER